MPQKLAGCRIDPPVSVPSEAAQRSAATAAADPPEDPPGTQSSAHGLRVRKKAEFSVEEPIANSSMLVFPSRIASCAFSRRMTVASYGGIYGSRIFDAQVVRTPCVQMTSLIASGIPANGGSGAPVPRIRSTASACFSAVASVRVVYALTCPSTRPIRSSTERTSSTALISRLFSSDCISWMVSRITSTVLLLQDSWDSEEEVMAIRRIRQGGLLSKRRRDLILAEDVGHRQDVGGRFDGRRIQFIQRIDVAQDRVKLRPHPLLLLCGQLQPSEPGDMFNLLQCDFHGVSPFDAESHRESVW